MIPPAGTVRMAEGQRERKNGMLNYIHSIPTQVFFGKGQISHLTGILGAYGKRVLLTYGGGSVKRIGLYDEVMKLLHDGGFEVTELSGIEPNPRIQSVEKGVLLCRQNRIDVILAVGGGSTIDCSKAIAAGVYYEGSDLWEMVRNARSLQKALPLVDILTLSATGSEYDSGAVITNLDTHEKLGRTFTYPAASICDPTYTFSVSAYQTAAGSADIMSHIFEGYFSETQDSCLSDGIAETVLKTVIRYCPIAIAKPDNYEARANLMSASSIACSGIPEYGKQRTGWPCHAMEHELSAYYDITHGVGLAILTPRWMRFILRKNPACAWRFAMLGRNVLGLTGEDEAGMAEQVVSAIENFFHTVGLPSSLRELKIGSERFAEMAVHANQNERLSHAFVPLTTDDLTAIYHDCL